LDNIKSLIDKLINGGNSEEREVILEYFESKGCNMERYKQRQEDKDNLISSINYN
jgi:hypothetical protein